MGRSRPSRSITQAAALMSLVAAVALPAHGATPKSGTLSSAGALLSWKGSASSPAGYTPPVYTPDLCAAVQSAGLCDAYSLSIDLPSKTFQKPGDGVFIDIRWESDFDQWNLFVYDSAGGLVGSGFDLDSDAQAILLEHPSNGVYTVVVAPVYQQTTMTYRGEARVFLDDTQRYPGASALLPRLWTAPPGDFHIECASVDPTTSRTAGCTDVPPLPSTPPGWRYGGAFGNSCYGEELAQPTIDDPETGLARVPRRCLRFTNNIRNVGSGSFILRIPTSAALGGTCVMRQVIRWTDGTERIRDAGECQFHPQHAHFHYLGVSTYALYRAPAANATTLPNLRARPVVRGTKIGYCLVDVNFFGNAAHPRTIWPRTYSFPTCNVPPRPPTSVESPFEEMGISRGWGDVYTWDLPGQFVDITGVPDGAYDLVSTANPDCKVAESAPGMEQAITRIILHGSDPVKVLGSFGPNPVPGCKPPTA